MSIEFEAVYENGILRPTKPLPLLEHQKVEGTIQPRRTLARETAGMIPWTGDADTLKLIATDPEFGLAETP